jgi:hypothetical protein
VLLVATTFACTVLTLRSSPPPAGSSGTWSVDGGTGVARAGAAAVLLHDGRVLVAGGSDGAHALASAELRASDGTFSAAASMGIARSGGAAVLLDDGRVLVAGGRADDGTSLGSAELYDPPTDTWYDVPGGMQEARADHTATRLPDGRVLVAGGTSSAGASATLEVFDPWTGLFEAAGSMSQARAGHAAALLDDGRVLLAGGSDGAQVLSGSDLFDSASGAVEAGPTLTSPRVHASATLLLDHRVLIAGGSDGTSDLASTEMFDPLVDALAPAPPLGTARQGHLALRLPLSNAVLLAGGSAAGQALDSAELFYPWRDVRVGTGTLMVPRADAALAPLSVGQVLAVGGSSTTSEAYRFATLWTDKDDYAPGTIVTISGSGWEPGETVSLVLRDGRCTPRLFSAVADAGGHILNQDFSPEHHDIGIRFWLTAIGSRSEAHTTFLDSPKVGAVSVSAQSPAAVNQGGSATYTVTIQRGNGNGSNGAFDVAFSFTTALPAGVTASFSPSTVHFNPPENTKTATMTLTTSAGTTPGGSAGFTLKGATSTQDFATGNGTLSICAPQISSQPSGLTRVVGQAASFSVTASGGSGSPTYQWRKSGVNIPGATSSTYSIASVLVADAGSYDVRVTDGCGSLLSSAAALVVPKASTTTTVTADSPDPSVVGQPVAISWSVAVTAPGAGTPTGNVTVSDGAGSSCVAAVAAGGCSIVLPTAGAKTLTASYAGDANFNSSSGNATHIVNTAATTTSASSVSPSPSVLGQSVSVSFLVSSVSPEAGTPTGTVTVSDGLGASCSASVAAGSCALSFTSVGARTLTASYAGDTSFLGSSGTAAHTVNKAAASVTTTVAPSPSVVGQAVSVSWSVTALAPGAGTPTGTVSVSDGLGASCSAAVTAGSCSLAFSSAVARSLSVSYGGDADFNGASVSVAHQVDKADTSTSVSAIAPGSSVVGQAVSVSWSVSVVAPGAGSPTGNVTVDDGAGAACSAAVADGTCSLTFGSAGPRILSVSYSGDADFNASSDSTSHQVNKADTTLSVSALSASPSVVGQPVSVPWSVSVLAPGAGSPTGSVTVDDGAGTSCSADLSAGSCTLAFGSAGPRILSVSYSGDADFNASSDSTSHQVDKAGTTTAILSHTPDPSVVDAPVAVIWSVSVNAPGSAAVTGNVTVDDGMGASCSAAASAGGCSLVPVVVGPKALTASYAGDENLLASTAGATHDVQKRTSSSVLSCTTNTVVVGATVSCTVTVTDTSAPGTPSAPQGSVTFASTKPGTFAPASCTLSGSGASASCTIQYTATLPNVQTLTASFGGDVKHHGGSGAFALQATYTFVGFFQPVENMPVLNSGKAGRTIPVKWQLKDAAGGFVSSLAAVVNNPLQYRQIHCDTSAPQDPLPADTSGSSGLRYDAGSGQYIFTWQTSGSFANKCYELLLDLDDGTQHVTRYKFTK